MGQKEHLFLPIKVLKKFSRQNQFYPNIQTDQNLNSMPQNSPNMKLKGTQIQSQNRLKKTTADPISNLKALDSGNKKKGGKWVLKVGRKIVPFCNESERAIRAVSNANSGEKEMSPLNDRSNHDLQHSPVNRSNTIVPLFHYFLVS
jgi:hypothetical protein